MVQNQYPEDVVPIEEEPHHRLVFSNDRVRFFIVEIAPHERTLRHDHPHDYLMYVMGEAQVVSTARDGKPTSHTYRDGDCELSSAGLIHVVENVRETKFRNLLVELMPGLNELQRGRDLRIAAEGGTIEAIFVEERISVWSLEMKPDGQAEVCGPAIVARLFKDELTAKINQVSDITWIESGRSVLGSDLGRTVRAIVFQLGRTEEQLAAARKRADEPINSPRVHADEPE